MADHTHTHIMESRKVIPMNLFQGRNRDTMQRMGLWTRQGEERVDRLRE